MVQSGTKSKGYKVTKNQSEIIKILFTNREGLRVKTIESLTGKSKRAVYKTLNKLKKKEIIENIFPIWKLKRNIIKEIQGKSKKGAMLLGSSDLDGIIELHDLSFVVRLLEKPSWWDRRHNYLERIKGFLVRKVSWGNNSYSQMVSDDFVIQTYSDSFIVMNRKRYHADDPYECLLRGTHDFLDVVEFLEERFRCKFLVDGVQNVTIRSSHFVRIGEALASMCKREGKKFLVDLGKRRKLWVDLSEPLGAESNTPELMKKYEELIRDRMTKASLLPSELTELSVGTARTVDELSLAIKDAIDSQVLYGEHHRTHVESIRILAENVASQSALLEGFSKNVVVLQSSFKRMEREFRKSMKKHVALEDDGSSQRSLLDF